MYSYVIIITLQFVRWCTFVGNIPFGSTNEEDDPQGKREDTSSGEYVGLSFIKQIGD